jgi:trehalose 6-phosphate phosphatase
MAQKAIRLSASESDALEPPPVDLLQGSSLFLDFDGTLVEIVERPDAVAVDTSLATLMSSLADKLQGRLAVVSGRPRAEIDALFGGASFAVSGSHGLELRWPDGRSMAPETPAGLAEIAARMRALAAVYPGILVEEKPFGAALHYRGAPDSEPECRALVMRLAAESGLILQAGKMVFELRAPGADKGAALHAFLEEPPMRGTRPVFLGDDVTDEDAFAAAFSLGGHGILVGEARPTAARYRLPDVAAARAWLDAAAGALA